MFYKKEITIAMILFTAPLVAFDSNQAFINLSEKLNKKHEITKKNFDLAIKYVGERPGGDYLAEKLRLKLSKFIEKKLSAEEWHSEYTKAYNEILETLGSGAFLMRMAHPIEELTLCMIWAIPSK